MFDGERDAGDEAAAADRDAHGVQRARFGAGGRERRHLLEDLEAARALTRQDVRVVVPASHSYTHTRAAASLYLLIVSIEQLKLLYCASYE